MNTCDKREKIQRYKKIYWFILLHLSFCKISWSTFKILVLLLDYKFLCLVIKDSDILSYTSQHLYCLFIVLLSSPNLDDDVFKCAILFQTIVQTIRTMKRVIGYIVDLKCKMSKNYRNMNARNSQVSYSRLNSNFQFLPRSIIGNPCISIL